MCLYFYVRLYIYIFYFHWCIVLHWRTWHFYLSSLQVKDFGLFYFDTIINRVSKNILVYVFCWLCIFLGHAYLKVKFQAMLCSAFIEIGYHFNMVSSPACIFIIHCFCSCLYLCLFGKPILFRVGLKIMIHRNDCHMNYWVYELLSSQWILIITVRITSFSSLIFHGSFPFLLFHALPLVQTPISHLYHTLVI